MKFFIEGGCVSSYRLMMDTFPESKETDNPKKADVIVFTGGSDILPSLYGEKNHSSGCNPQRDQICLWLWRKMQGRKFIGICRGAQFLSAMLGGKLMQDIRGHSDFGRHLTDTGMAINSLHHQGIIKHDGLGTVLHMGPHEFAGQINGKWTDGVNNVESFISDKCFGVQWHPEYMNRNWGTWVRGEFGEFIPAQEQQKEEAVLWWMGKAKAFLK